MIKMIRRLIIFALLLFAPLAIKLTSYLFYKPVGVVKLQTARADIVDSTGVLLATTIPTQSVYIIPYEVLEKEKIINDLSEILNVEREKIAARFEVPSKKFVWVLRHIAPWQASAITQLNYSGVYVARDMRRFYPLGGLCVHILGRVDDMNNGISGVELAFDSQLKKSKQPLQLSLSVPVQFVLKDVLDEAKKEFSAKSGYGMIICAKTGRILASYSQSGNSDINPHENDQEAVNLNTQHVAERGSVFKTINAAMLLENDLVELKTEIFAPAELKIGKHRIHDVDKRTKDCIYSFERAFAKSSNIVHGLFTIKAGAQKQVEFFERVGILEDMKIDNLSVARGLIPKKWSVATCITAAYGHSIATTNAQYMRAMLRMITGCESQLHILQNYSGAENSLDNSSANSSTSSAINEQKRIIKQSTCDKIKYLLRLTFTSSWYGKQNEVAGYEIGGKTGTANKLIDGKYIDKHSVCTYCFIFPAHDPQIIGIVSLDEPKATPKTFGFVLASFNVAPLGPKIIKKIGPILGLVGK